MTPLDNFLSHLSGVKQTGQGKYQACCPSHEDKSPSLAITEGDKGQVVFHCFGGCEKQAILDSVGLNWVDLYPRDSTFAGNGKGIQTGRSPLSVCNTACKCCSCSAQKPTRKDQNNAIRL